jgi:hypothetical protein
MASDPLDSIYGLLIALTIGISSQRYICI